MKTEHEGFLQVSIDGVIKVPQKGFYFEETVLDRCFKQFDNITVQNKHNNAWKGTIVVTINGINIPLECKNCTGIKSNSYGTHEIVVDGNEDSANEAPMRCLNGSSCTFTINGKIT